MGDRQLVELLEVEQLQRESKIEGVADIVVVLDGALQIGIAILNGTLSWS